MFSLSHFPCSKLELRRLVSGSRRARSSLFAVGFAEFAFDIIRIARFCVLRVIDSLVFCCLLFHLSRIILETTCLSSGALTFRDRLIAVSYPPLSQRCHDSTLFSVKLENHSACVKS